MELEILLSTMNQQDDALIKKMNIRSNTIMINQSDHFGCSKSVLEGKSIQLFSFPERGIGLSRNTALMRASKDICLFADDDVKYNEDYENKIIREFESHPKADVLIFNIPNSNAFRASNEITKFHRINWFNCLRYGTYQIAVRRENIWKKNIWFSLLYGGGAKYSCGEDSLFLWNCLQKRLRIYAAPVTIGTVSHSQSTWFQGYTEKYFVDKGCLYYSLSPGLAFLLCLQFAVRKKKLYQSNFSMRQVCKFMFEGINKTNTQNRN